MEKKEFKVGEVFQCGLVKLKCYKAKKEDEERTIIPRCEGCIFVEKRACGSVWEYEPCEKSEVIDMFVGQCEAECRKDKTDVIFVKVED